jgi:hypothetical protein
MDDIQTKNTICILRIRTQSKPKQTKANQSKSKQIKADQR